MAIELHFTLSDEQLDLLAQAVAFHLRGGDPSPGKPPEAKPAPAPAAPPAKTAPKPGKGGRVDQGLVLRLAREGRRSADIADEAGCSMSSVQRICRANGLAMRRTGGKEGVPHPDFVGRLGRRMFDHDEAAELFMSGCEIEDLADRYGVAYGAMRSMLLRRGLVSLPEREAALADDVVRLRGEGMTFGDVGKRLGVPFFKAANIYAHSMGGQPRKEAA